MLYILIWLLINPLAEAKVQWARLARPSPLYAKPNTESRVLVMLKAGDRVAVRESLGEFRRVQYRQKDKWRTGYVFNLDLSPSEQAEKPRQWGAGWTAFQTSFEHEGKKFTTVDEVNYTTDAYKSTATSYGVIAQLRDSHFWRFFLGRRMTKWKTTARNDVSPKESEVTLDHKMWSFITQKAWTPLSRWKILYLGGGIEAARATDMKLTINGSKLVTSEEDLPFYFGGHAMAGAQVQLPFRLSLFAEFRYTVYLHDPAIQGTEIAGGILYWP